MYPTPDVVSYIEALDSGAGNLGVRHTGINAMNDYDGLMNYNPVTLDQAKLLKSLGFVRPTTFYWQDTECIPYVEKGLKIADTAINHNSAKFTEVQVYSAPSIKDDDVLLLFVKHLRETTGIGLMYCKKALLDNNFDVDKALIAVKNLKTNCLVTYKMDDA